MFWRKYILTIFFVATGFAKLFACPEATNILILNGDTASIYLNSLPSELQKSNLAVRRCRVVTHLFGDDGSIWVNSGSMYEFEITWEIKNDQLYLTGIYSWGYERDSIKADLSELFQEVVNGKIKANWVSGKVRGGKKLIFYHLGLIPIYEKELEFEFFEGRLLNVTTFDNSRTRLSYRQNREKLPNFIYRNIDWDNLPQQQMPVVVAVEFWSNEDGTINEVQVTRKSDIEIFNQEAVRVIKSIPDFDVVYRKGQHFPAAAWGMTSIVFSEENREKFGR